MRTLRDAALLEGWVLNSDILEVMSILDITEEKIFETLGRGRNPDYKPIERARLIKLVEPFDFTRLLQ